MRRPGLALSALLAAGCPRSPEAPREVAAPREGEGVVVWRRELGAEARGLPLVAEGAVYVGDEAGTIHAFEARSGRELWTAPLRSDAFLPIVARPALCGGLLLVADAGGRVAAMDPASGAERWRVEVEGEPRAPLLCDGSTLWVGSATFGILALDVGTGEERWRRVDQQRWTSLTLLGADQLCARGFSSPAGDGVVVCLDRGRGWERWRQYFGRVEGSALWSLPEGELLGARAGRVERYGEGGLVRASALAGEGGGVLLDGQTLWASGGDGVLRGFTLPALTPLWSAVSEGAAQGPPARVCQDVVTAELGGYFVGHDARTGARSWSLVEPVTGTEAPAQSVQAAGDLALGVLGTRLLAISPPGCGG